MKLEQQVCSRELAEKIDSLITKRQDHLFAYYGNDGKWSDAIVPMDMYQDIVIEGFDKEKLLPAYTVAELGEMLPERLETKEEFIGYLTLSREYPDWVVSYCVGEPSGNSIVVERDDRYMSFSSMIEADARARMLIYLIENGLITPPTN